MHLPTFDNAFLRALPGDPEPRNFVRLVQGASWSKVEPEPVAAPRLLAHSREMATELGFSEADVAAMLAAMHERFHMALVLVPGIALAVSIGAWTVARKRLPEKAFSELKAQLDADAQVLRTIGGRS